MVVKEKEEGVFIAYKREERKKATKKGAGRRLFILSSAVGKRPNGRRRMFIFIAVNSSPSSRQLPNFSVGGGYRKREECCQCCFKKNFHPAQATQKAMEEPQQSQKKQGLSLFSSFFIQSTQRHTNNTNRNQATCRRRVDKR